MDANAALDKAIEEINYLTGLMQALGFTNVGLAVPNSAACNTCGSLVVKTEHWLTTHREHCA